MGAENLKATNRVLLEVKGLKTYFPLEEGTVRAVDGGSATDETLSWLDGSNADAREGCNGRDSEAAVVAAWPAQPYRNRRRGRDHDASQWCGVDQSR